MRDRYSLVNESEDISHWQDDIGHDKLVVDNFKENKLLENNIVDDYFLKHNITINHAQLDYFRDRQQFGSLCSNSRNDEKSSLIHKQKDDSCYIPARYVLAFWSFLGFVNMFTLRMDINVAILDMVKSENKSLMRPLTNSSSDVLAEKMPHRFHWSENQQYTVISAFYYGYCSTQILGGYLSGRYGGKLVLGLGLLVTSLLTLAMPFAVWQSFGLLVACRVGQGLAQGLAQPCMHTIWSNWAPESEMTKLMTITYSGCQLGTIIATLISGYLCQFDVLGGWQSVFYLFGSAGVIWSVHWLVLIYDTPRQHPRISKKERKFIESNIKRNLNKTHTTPSWTQVIKSPALHAIIAAHFANDWGCFALTTCLPKYLKSILQYDLTQNGFLSSLPFVVLLITNPLSGFVADSLRTRQILTTKNTRKLMNSLGLFIPSGLMVAVCFMDESRTKVVVLLILAVGISGFTMAGYSVNHLDIAPQFAGVLYGVTNTIGTITGFIGPTILGILTNEQNTPHQWHIFFYITSAIFFTGGIIFLFFAQGEPQDWAASNSELSYQEPETEKHNPSINDE